MQFKLTVFYINICGFVSNEYTAVGIFCYSSNALSTFVYGINLVQTVATIFLIQYGSCLPSWILGDVIYAQHHNGSDEGHLQFKLGEAQSTASKVMKILQNAKWPPSVILNFYMTSIILSEAIAVARGISSLNLVKIDLLLQDL